MELDNIGDSHLLLFIDLNMIVGEIEFDGDAQSNRSGVFRMTQV